MFWNYFAMGWRSLVKNKTYSVINMLGLAAGLSSFIIILLYLNYELSYDKWDPELKKVYRISLRSEGDILPQTPAPLASLLAQKYVNAATGTSLQATGDFEILVAANGKKIYQNGVVFVDSSFLKVFPYTLVKGDASTALNQPDAVILDEELAQKLFGNADPIGKTLKTFNANDGIITGVMRKPRGPSHLKAQLLIRYPYTKQSNFWENYSFQTYIKVRKPVSEPFIEEDINWIFFNERLKKDNKPYKKEDQRTSLFIDAAPNIHNFPKYGNSNFSTVSGLLILAFLLLLAGAINFSNLAIAKSIGRAKEVGVRKVLGAGQRQLILQFMIETALQCIISLCIAASVVYMALPYLNNSFNLTLSFWQQDNPAAVILQIVLCLLLVTLLSGLYPSLFLSRLNTTKVLKGDYSSGKRGVLFRNALIVAQFMVSAFFIIATLVISMQMDYLQNRDKGFSDDQVMRIEATQKTREGNFASARNVLLSITGVSAVAKTTSVPGDNPTTDTATYKFKYAGKEYRLRSVKISADYFKALQIPLVQGALFADDLADQNTRTAIINEAAVKKMNMTDPIGKVISFPNCDSVPIRIKGVVKDINAQGFELAVQPVVYTIGNKACMYQSGGAMLVKLSANQMERSVAAIEHAWKEIEPDFAIRYSFLDDNFQRLFLSYVRLQQVISYFAIIAVVISIMGLFALTAFFTKQRTKEIGVRKVLGATVTSIATLLSKESIYPVLLSVLIVTPIGWWSTQMWLRTFAYRVEITWWIFVLTGLIIICIALAAVSLQALKAAMVNPVKSLRRE